MARLTKEELQDASLAELTAQVKLLSGSFANEMSECEENSLRINAYIRKGKAQKESVFKFLRQVARRKEDLAIIENANKRLHLHLPKILQVLGCGIKEDE